MSRAGVRALQGIALAAGAPLGWLAIRWAQGAGPLAELAANPGVYAYMLLASAIVFGIVGALLGSREARMLALNHRLEELAVTDPLTGLRNARYFYARLDEEQAERARTGRPLAVAIIDLDGFKYVNDTYGHQVGDDVLVNAAMAIESVTRQGETEARIGGEEFALLLPGSTGSAAGEAAERARRAIAAARTPIDGRFIRVTASAGVASTADFADANAQQLCKAADDALYRAKAEGRNRTCIASDAKTGQSGDPDLFRPWRQARAHS